MHKEAEFQELEGKTLVEIRGHVGADEVVFVASDGSEYKLYHEDDCCESVLVEDIIGDLKDLLGNPMLVAREECSENVDHPEGDSVTWTFYILSTIKGSVTIRWGGYSNGYYSEKVDFAQIKEVSLNTKNFNLSKEQIATLKIGSLVILEAERACTYYSNGAVGEKVPLLHFATAKRITEEYKRFLNES